MHVFCDFDGTISVGDTTDLVLSRLAAPSWQDVESEWLAGRIDAASCMRQQVALIGGSDADLDEVLDGVELDPGFARFAAWCADRAIPLSIVSDGVDRFIRQILARHGLGGLPIVSNELAGRPGARELRQPHRRAGCAAGSGVCKCAVTAAAPVGGRQMVYVGDGRSDFCVSQRADVLFAKGALADYAAGRGQAHHVYDTFHDITAKLAPLLAARRAAAL